MKHFILHASWRVILVRNLPFGDGELRIIGYVSTIVGISGFNPRTRLCLIQDLRWVRVGCLRCAIAFLKLVS
ncbi:MAG: hypothetical protein V7K53_22110 [Nostoc sp.]|uniref:hypothetical protein n=1 Tax=Nostoc sp. TaxID=1180 RepID=UPI002FF4F83D